MVCNILVSFAHETLPHFQITNHKKHAFHDSELKSLCNSSRAAWSAWNHAGCPESGPLWEQKKLAKRKFNKEWIFSMPSKKGEGSQKLISSSKIKSEIVSGWRRQSPSQHQNWESMETSPQNHLNYCQHGLHIFSDYQKAKFWTPILLRKTSNLYGPLLPLRMLRI